MPIGEMTEPERPNQFLDEPIRIRIVTVEHRHRPYPSLHTAPLHRRRVPLQRLTPVLLRRLYKCHSNMLLRHP